MGGDTGGKGMGREMRPGVVLGTLCVSLTAITVNLSLLNVALPTMARQLNTSNTGLEWIVDGYALVFAGLLLAAGSLGDRVGRKHTLMVGLVVFGVSSGLAAFADSTGLLITARCLMGVGAALVMPMTLSILTDIYPTEAGLRRAIGIWAATASAGAVVAPLAAGLLLSHFWWGSVFVLNVPLSFAVVGAVAVTVPSTAPRRGTAIDWVGVFLSILFSSGLVFALIEGPSRGWSSPLVAGSLAGSVVATAAFCLWELRVERPLLDVRCFRLPPFSIGCGVVALQYFLSFGTSFVITQYLQLVLGRSALVAGMILMPSAALLMVVSPLGARAFGRFGARPVTTIALLTCAIGATTMVLAGTGSSVAVILVSNVLVSLGIGLMAPGTTSMVMSALPPDRAGMASGAQSATRQLGGALGVAVLGTLLASRYAAAVTHSLAGTAAAPLVGTARRSLAAALETAPSAGSLANVLTASARSAFVDGMHLVGVVAGIVAGIAAVAVFWVLALGRVPRPSAEPALVTVDASVAPETAGS